MSTLASFKRAIPIRKYRERGQLERRKHLGLLEKKSDYKVRATDYHKKEDKLAKLRTQARLRNPDEFYFRMISSKIEDGKHVDYEKGDEEDEDPERKKELKSIELTKGANMVKLQKYRDASKVQKMKAEMNMIGFEHENKHTIFVKSKEEFDNFDPAKHFNTLPELVDQKHNRVTVDMLENEPLSGNLRESKKISEKVKQSYKKYADKIENAQKMEDYYLKLDYKKTLINGGKKKLKKYDTGTQFKFFSERKR
eukprot:CAMPEP_0176418856 /NCGR_PEP_ID=MMETSP0127-20121128/7716_1 /TAXON_ID=938130 /ORGANISM="Platyophrya macrostoma, Strain WH" /LENGTH=252 /DNA_ID=CAMNT_0017799253 /DNA_START=25 /DNA_END=783 /DNA_ORIENTATION=+